MSCNSWPSASLLKIPCSILIVYALVSVMAGLWPAQSADAQVSEPAAQTEDSNDVHVITDLPIDSCPAMPVIITSDPESTSVTVDSTTPGFQTPVRLVLPGEFSIDLTPSG